LVSRSTAYAAQSHLPSAQQSQAQPQSPVQTPVSQQPQSHAAQQQGSQLAGQAPPQHEAGAAEAGANNDRTSNTRKYMV
jgi:DNA mismatch repair ATPase MutL